MRIALGFRAHSGWAVLAAVAMRGKEPAVVARLRIEMADAGDHSAKQPYHAAEGLDLGEAEALVSRAAAEARRRAMEGLRAAVEALSRDGHEAAIASVLLGSGRLPDTLEATLASHSFIHAAEGELFRDALRAACAACGLPVTGVREKVLFAEAERALRLPADEIRARLAALRRSLGPPWREDEKLATVAAWMALAGRD